MHGMIHEITIKSPASDTRNACSSLPECFKTCPSIVTRIPTAAILKINSIVIVFSFSFCVLTKSKEEMTPGVHRF